MKKLLSLLLALCLCFSLLPAAVFAGGDELDSDAPVEDGVPDVPSDDENDATAEDDAPDISNASPEGGAVSEADGGVSDDNAAVGDGVLDVPSDDAAAPSAGDDAPDVPSDDDNDAPAGDDAPSAPNDDNDTPSDDDSDESEILPVRVEFVCDPPETVVTVYDLSQLDEEGNPAVVEPEEDGAYLLLPGEYLYDAVCEGYPSIESAVLLVRLPENEMDQTVKIFLDASSQTDAILADEHSELEISSSESNNGSTESPKHTRVEVPDLSGCNVQQRLSILQGLFPKGKYWNHYAESSSDVIVSYETKYPYYISDHPCKIHPLVDGGTQAAGQYVCNGFDGSAQCFGFARLIYYLVFGERLFEDNNNRESYHYTKDKDPNFMTGILPGDYFSTGGHQAIVLSVDQTTQRLLAFEANDTSIGKCAINNTRYYSFSQITGYWHSPKYDQIEASDPPSIPTPHASAAANITHVNATVHGYIAFPENLRPTSWGIDVTTDSDNWTGTNIPLNKSNVISGTATNPVVIDIDFSKDVNAENNPLRPDTQYWYRLWVKYTDPSSGQTRSNHSEVFPLKTKAEPTYALKVCAELNGDDDYTLGALATADVYINDELVGTGVSAFPEESYVAGTRYEIRNITPGERYAYLGESTISGTIQAGENKVCLPFASKHEIAYYREGGSGTMETQTVLFGTDFQLLPNTFTKAGESFSGWTLQRRLDGKWYTSDQKDWFTLEEIQEHGYVLMKYADQTDCFLGKTWLKSQDASGFSYYGFHAQWTPNTLQFKYHANGGAVGENERGFTLANNGIIQCNGAEYITSWKYSEEHAGGLANNTTLALTRPGYSFLGWSLSSDGSTTVFDQNEDLSAEMLYPALVNGDASVTFYAIWTPNTYTFHYYAGGGSGTMADTRVVFNSEYALRKSTFTNTGHSFRGWNVQRDDGKWYVAQQGWLSEDEITAGNWTKYIFGDEITGTFGSSWLAGCPKASEYTFYALWTPNTYTFHYNAGGGSDTMADTRVVFNSEYALRKSTFTNTGHSIRGWNVQRDDGTWYVAGHGWLSEREIRTGGLTKYIYGDEITGTFGSSWLSGCPDAREYTFYALWTPKTYTFHYNAGDGGGTMADTRVMFNSEYALRKCTFTKTGHMISGWNVMRDDGTWYVAGQGWLTEDEIAAGNRTKYVYADEKTGSFSSSWLAGCPEASEYTFYALWTPKTYTFHYNAGDGSGTMADTHVVFNSEYALRKCAFTNTGYNFRGWNVMRDDGTWYVAGQGWLTENEIAAGNRIKYVYADEKTGSFGSSWLTDCSNAGAFTFYAVWTPVTYTLHYMADGGNGAMANSSVVFGEDFLVAQNPFTLDDHHFAGWNVKRTVDGKWFVAKEGWFDQETIDAVGYNKALYVAERTKRISKSWLNGTDGETEFEFWAVWIENDAPAFASHSLLLSGEIGVNFYMDLSGLSEAEKAASSMTFTVNGTEQTDVFDASHTNPGGNGYYGFTCTISSVQMADEITAVFHYGKDKSVIQVYSAKDYVDYVSENPGGYTANTRALVASLGSYGANVQPFLATSNGWTLGEAHTAMTGGVSYDADALDTIRGTAANYAFGKDLGSSQVAKVSYSLDLQSKTDLRVYFTLQPGYTGAVTATLDGSPVTAARLSDGRYCVTVPSIAAHELGTAHSIVLSAGGACTVTVSALSYVDAALRSSSKVFANDTARAAVASLYDYYAATANYLANPAA